MESGKCTPQYILWGIFKRLDDIRDHGPWFDKFLEQITERPLLLLFDGHLTHFSIDVVKKALENDIILIKLPPHVTDVMQRLEAWERLLNNNTGISGPKTLLNKSTFVNMLCSIWTDLMTPNNAIAGFKATGIFPCDPLKYPKGRFDKRLGKKFDAWITAGEPEKRDYALVEPVETEEMQNEDEMDITLTATSSSTSNLPYVSTPAIHQPPPVQSDSTLFIQPTDILIVPPLPYRAPSGFRWRCKLELEKVDQEVVYTTCTDNRCKL